jgi:Restriction endonuclease
MVNRSSPITVELGPDETVSVQISGTDIEVLDVADGVVIAECEFDQIKEFLTAVLPTDLLLQVSDPGGFGIFPFYEIQLLRTDERVAVEFLCHEPNKYWEHRWGLATWLSAVRDQCVHHGALEVVDVELNDDWKRLAIRAFLPLIGTFEEALTPVVDELRKAIREAEAGLAGMVWRKDFEEDERLFCTDFLAPLLRRMGFSDVSYSHGTREYGRDFTFSEMTPFGVLRHYGLQAKAGSVRGGVRSAIDEIIGQIDDAFKMPYIHTSSREAQVHFNSANFTDNAKEKLIEKIRPGLVGSVSFLDRDKLIELSEMHWTA